MDFLPDTADSEPEVSAPATPEQLQEGIALLKRVQEFDAAEMFTGKTDSEVSSMVWLVRTGAKVVGLDPTQRGLLVRRLKAATGLTEKQLGIPPAVDVMARAERNQRQRAFADGADENLIDPEDAKDTAQRFLDSTADNAGWPELVRYEGEFFVAQGTHYRPVSDEVVAAQLYGFLAGKVDVTTGKPIKPDRSLVEGILHAARAAALISVPEVPSWIGSAAGRVPARAIVPFANGLLDLESRQLLKPTRSFFNVNARDYPYQPKAPPPLKFLTFLRDTFGEDTESIETLQEIFGLLLTPDTSFQKAFLIVGPPRSGKGTLLRILQRLLGAPNVCGPAMGSLGGSFGLQGLIGKLAALISDARLSSRADVQTIGETLLRITGEDTVSIPRKFKDDWTTKLPTRFVVATNELPALLDQSGALASRFIVLQLTQSFLGKEDQGLTDRLLGEVSGIANWALDGLDRLYERGHFRQPASAMEAVRQLKTLGSPIKAFIADRCVLEAGGSVECGRLFNEWRFWASEQGRDQLGTAPVFGRNLAAAFPNIRVVRPRVGESRERRYEGLRLRETGDPETEDRS